MSIATPHTSPLISLPPKATEEVDLAAAVRVLIRNTYAQNPNDFSEQLAALNRARQDAVRGAASEATARDLLYKWFHMLEMLELRFPELRLPFPWKDAFTSKSISQQSLAYEKASIIFNIASVLSSIAARATRLGAPYSNPSASSGSVPSSAAGASSQASTTTATSSDGLKLSYTSFRQSAGMLSYINDNFLHAPSTDMSKDVVRWLVTLMLAQANEVLWEKTVEEKKSHSLAARLAMQCSVTYRQLDEDAKEWVQKGVFERTWMLLVQTKAKHFASVAQYYRALADSASSNHGACLVRLGLSLSLANEAARLAHVFSSHMLTGSYATGWGLSGSDSPPLFPRPSSPTSPTEGSSSSKGTLPSDAGSAMAGLVAAHQSIVTERRAEAVKDNDLIYHDILPSESALPAIEPMSAATPISIQDIYASPEVQKLLGVPVARGGSAAARSGGASGLASNDLFSKLVPLGVHESASMYSEEKAKLARAESEKCDLADGELQASLDYMGLPAALSRFKGVGPTGGLGTNAIEALVDPGAEVRAWADEEESGTDVARDIDASLSRIEGTHRQAIADLDEAKRLLDEDNMQCEKLRVRFGAAWEQEPGAAATKALRRDIKAHREAAVQAADNNERIRSSWEAVRADYSILTGGRERLEAAFAEAIASGGGSAQRSNGGAGLLDLSEEQERASEADAARLSALASTVESLLSTLSKLKRDRAECLTDLKARIQSDDISNLLVLHRRSPPEALQGIFAQELEKFRGHQSRIHKSLAEQAKVLTELARSWKEIKESAAGRRVEEEFAKKSRARKALVERLRKAKEDGRDLRVMLAKANAFYQELGGLVEQSRNEARGFSRERAEGRERLRQKVEWDEKGRDGSSGGGGGGDYESFGSSARARYDSPTAGRYASPPPPPPGSQQPQGLDAAFGSMNLGGGGRGPAPPPVLRAPSGSYGGVGPSYASPPPAPSSSSYGALPPPPPQPRQSAPTSPYDALGAFESTYASPASRAPTSYERGPAPPPSHGQGQWGGSSIPPPPQQPTRTPSLPPPPPQLSYLSSNPTSGTGAYGSSPGMGAQSPYSPQQQHQAYAQPPPPPQPTSQYAYAQPQQPQPHAYNYNAPSQPAQQGYAQQGYAQQGYGQSAQAQSPYGAPPPPPPQQQYGNNQWQGRGY